MSLYHTKGDTEVVKRSANVNVDDTVTRADRQLADSRTIPNASAYDDLEARIRAALERSEATFRAVSAGTPYYGTTTYTPSYAGTYTSNYPYTSTYNPVYTSGTNAPGEEVREVTSTERKASETEKVVKSSAPGISDETGNAPTEVAKVETDTVKVEGEIGAPKVETTGSYVPGSYTYTNPNPYAYSYVPTSTYTTYGGTGSISPTRLSSYLTSNVEGGTSGAVKDIVKDVILNEKVEEIVKSSSPRNLKKSSSPRKGDIVFTSGYIPASTTTYTYGGVGGTYVPGNYTFSSTYPYTYTNYGATVGGTTTGTGTGTGTEGTDTSKQYTVTYDVQSTGEQNQGTIEQHNKEMIVTNETGAQAEATTNEGGFSEEVNKVQD
jgi:hypothetical protein